MLDTVAEIPASWRCQASTTAGGGSCTASHTLQDFERPDSTGIWTLAKGAVVKYIPRFQPHPVTVVFIVNVMVALCVTALCRVRQHVPACLAVHATRFQTTCRLFEKLYPWVVVC